MYTANIDRKTFSGGKLTVKVTYSNGNENITEDLIYTQAQDENYINDIISRKLNDLNSLSNLYDSIVIGNYNLKEASNSDKDLYYKKASEYMKFMNIARMGLIPHDRAIIIELNTWLKANFKDEYANTF